MKSVVLFVGLVVMGVSALAQKATLVVEIPQLAIAQGFLLVSVFAGPDGFPEDPDKATAISSTSALKGTNTLTFEGLEPGEYAVAAAHDENANGEVDTNSFGLPTEPVGFSNDPSLFGKPTFEQTKFTVVAPMTKKVVKVKKLFTPLDQNNQYLILQ